MARQMSATEGLTPKQQLVMKALNDAERPLSAYTLLDLLRDDGFRAPLQVYRALEKLLETGLAHRLESLNAFVACRHPACDSDNHETIVFTICEECGKVQERNGENLAAQLHAIAGEAKFKSRKSIIELRGCCEECLPGSSDTPS